MSTSYNNRASQSILDVEAFIYRDTFGGLPATNALVDSQAEQGDANPDKTSNLPRISEEEISSLVSQARQEGLAEGTRLAESRFREDLAQERERVDRTISDFQRQRADYYSKVEGELLHLALAIAAKILHRESQIDRMVVAGLVKVMLERLQQETKVSVRVRPEDAEGWRQYFREQSNLQVVEDVSLEPKACLLETELGIADMSLNAQLKEVERGFFDLLAQNPEPK